MDRVNLGGGRWFDRDAADLFSESRYHDGRNFISRATGSQWEHEELYRTRGGSWILCSWSQWQGSGPPHYSVISSERAYAWLIEHNYTSHVPPDVLAAAEVA